MKYLRGFNESKSDDFADYTLFEVDPDESMSGRDWYFGRWYFTDEFNLQTKPQLGDLDRLLNSKRFGDLVAIRNKMSWQSVPKEEWEILWDDGLDILIVTNDYYKENSKWLVSNLNWERHPLAVEMDKDPQLNKSYKLISDKATIVKNLPNQCSLIRGMRFGDGLEFWPQGHLRDPIYVESDVELQALIYKYICDGVANEGLFGLFKKKIG